MNQVHIWSKNSLDPAVESIVAVPVETVLSRISEVSSEIGDEDIFFANNQVILEVEIQEVRRCVVHEAREDWSGWVPWRVWTDRDGYGCLVDDQTCMVYMSKQLVYEHITGVWPESVELDIRSHLNPLGPSRFLWTLFQCTYTHYVSFISGTLFRMYMRLDRLTAYIIPIGVYQSCRSFSHQMWIRDVCVNVNSIWFQISSVIECQSFIADRKYFISHIYYIRFTYVAVYQSKSQFIASVPTQIFFHISIALLPKFHKYCIVPTFHKYSHV